MCVRARALDFVFLARLPYNVYVSFIRLLMQISPFFHNLAILFSEIVIFMIDG